MPAVLDMCCGSRMFWHNKKDPRTVYVDIRAGVWPQPDRGPLEVMPDIIADFRSLPFADETFWQVVFDPPHLHDVGPNSRMKLKYGQLDRRTWQEDIRQGFAEAFRVLRPGGTLIFKWNETQIPTSQVLALTDHQPTVKQRTGKADKTHWILFFKSEAA